MATAQIKQVTATGDITTAGAHLHSLLLTAGSDAATLTVRAGGSGGTIVAVLKAAANTSAPYPFGAGVLCSGGIHATLAGTGPSASAVYS